MLFDYEKQEKLYNIIPIFDKEIGEIIIKTENDSPVNETTSVFIKGIPIDIEKIDKYRYKKNINDEWKEMRYDKELGLILN